MRVFDGFGQEQVIDTEPTEMPPEAKAQAASVMGKGIGMAPIIVGLLALALIGVVVMARK